MIDLIDKNVGILGNSFLSIFFFDFLFQRNSTVLKPLRIIYSFDQYTVLSCVGFHFGNFKTTL